MNTIHNIIQKIFVLGIAFCFMFVAIYVPQSWNKVDEAEAAWATTAMQAVQLVEDAYTSIQSYLTTVATVAIEWFQGSLWSKEWVLDGIGWWVAKMIISQITRQIVTWINSGFQGSPAFVQDLESFALRMADQAAGLYLANLGSPLLSQFVCAPFRLNLQIAISANYRYGRSGLPYGASRCSLTQGMENIGRFTDGSFIQGGWNTWYQVSSQPLTYTPYGEYLAAQNQLALQANISVRNQNTFLGFGQGFFSNKICDVISTAAVPKERCLVSTPGHVISENLNFHLTAGTRSLIAADEINEILGALLGQLAQTVITGSHGLLGMSDNTGYTLPEGHLQTMEEEQASAAAPLTKKYLDRADEQLALEQKYNELASEAIPLLERINTTESINERERALAIQNETAENIRIITELRARILTAGTADVTNIINDYNNLKLHTETQYQTDFKKWLGLFETEYKAAVAVIDEAISFLNEYEPLLVERGRYNNDDYARQARAEVIKINNDYRPMVTLQKAELDAIAIEWNNPTIPKVQVLNHYLDLKYGEIPGIPKLFSREDMSDVTNHWDNILQIP